MYVVHKGLSYVKLLEKELYYSDDENSSFHKDFSARVHIVDNVTNKMFYNLINEFYKETGVPVLLNTSFNLNGELIVCSPTDAIRTFYSCGLDILVMDNFIVYK